MSTYSLAQIKAHPNYPFDDFLTNDVSFLMAELYWPELFAEIMGRQVAGWTPVKAGERDGNPIFAIYNRSVGRALRVIQKFNEDKKPKYPDSVGRGVYYPVQPWCNITTTPTGDMELLELVLFSDCSQFSETVNRILITKHCVDKVSPDAMERLISEYEQRVGMPD